MSQTSIIYGSRCDTGMSEGAANFANLKNFIDLQHVAAKDIRTLTVFIYYFSSNKCFVSLTVDNCPKCAAAVLTSQF